MMTPRYSLNRNACHGWIFLLIVLSLAGCPSADQSPPAPQPAVNTRMAKTDGTAPTTDGADVPPAETEPANKNRIASNSGDEQHGGEQHRDEQHGDEQHRDEQHGDERHGGEQHGGEQHGDDRAKHQGEPKKIDFVELNGAIFTGWEKPKLAVVLSGMQDGYIEPCGCAGLENQKGGLSRRHSMMLERQQEQWTLTAFDLGGMVRRFGPQAAIKYQRAFEALQTLDYSVIGVGARDLKLPTANLLTNIVEGKPRPFVSANVVSVFDDEDFGLFSHYRVVDAGGARVGVTQVLGSERGAELQNADFQFRSPSEALPEVVERLKAEKCDLLILLANTTNEEARALAVEFGDFDFIVTAVDADPEPEPQKIKGTDTRLIDVGYKGMYVGVLGIYDQQPVRYQRVPLDGRFPDSEQMTAMMVSYQEQLEGQGFAGLEVRPIPHPTGRKFVGSDACRDCHSDEYDIWKDSPHAHATDRIVALKPARHFDPECLSCHVTGWEPQEYYPFVSGYTSLAETPHLYGNGCENCHGPGADHVAAQWAEENGEDVDEERIELLQSKMRLTLEDARKNRCIHCHDLDNSPDFDFEKDWPEIEH